MEKYGNMAFPNKSETVKEVKLPILNQILCFLPIPVPRYCTKFRQHKIFQITRYLVKYFMNENCCNSRTKNDIDMKLGLVSNLEKRKNDNFNVVFTPMQGFPYWGDVGVPLH